MPILLLITSTAGMINGLPSLGGLDNLDIGALITDFDLPDFLAQTELILPEIQVEILEIIFYTIRF